MACNGQQPSYWVRNPDKANQLRQLWTEGYSAAQIVGMLGAGKEITRNAVIGKAHRMGLRHRDREIIEPKKKLEAKPRKFSTEPKNGKTYRAKHKPEPDDEIVPAPYMLTDLPFEDTVTQVSLLDCKAHHCRWPVASQTFCGARIRANSSYCPTHHKRATTNSRGPYNARPRHISKYW